MHRVATAMLAALALVASAGDPARADDTYPDPEDGTHFWTAAYEAAVALAIPTEWYWSTKVHQQVDFELDGSWSSWRAKLFSTGKWAFDTNPFHVNAIRHPIAGAVDYQIIRSNGYSPLTSALFALVKGAAWEYFIEYREDPSINDVIFNYAGGIAIAEPMFQIGQLWRGGQLSLADRARTALFSPFDAWHDTYRAQHRFVRPSRWASIELDAAASTHDVTFSGDIDVVANRAFAEGGAWSGDVKAGSWSRLRASVTFGPNEDGTGRAGTSLRTETLLAGHYTQDADGTGTLYALGTGFTYRQDWLTIDRDHFALAHLFGPHLQLSKRHGDTTVLWDAAAYADFGLVEALVFSPMSPFPKPPPYISALQSDGYIDAAGLTATTRLRVHTGPWRAEAELDAHVLHQLVNHDRDDVGAAEAPRETVPPGVSVTGIDELRALWRTQVIYQPGTLGGGIVASGARRTSTWRDLERTESDYTIGAELQLAY